MKNFFARWWIVACFLTIPAAAFASADFYGVKMASESYAKDLVIDESSGQPAFTVERPGMDKRVFAYGKLASILGASKGISVKVFNNSDKTLPTGYDLAEYTVVTKDGERHSLAPPAMVFPAVDSIEPRKNAVFKPPSIMSHGSAASLLRSRKM